MQIDRRKLLVRAVAGAESVPADAIYTLAIQPNRLRRVSQSELTGAIENHAMWLDGDGKGRRAMFSNCDLSGLDFLSTQETLVNLRGSDFTEADMTGVIGNLISFNYASLHGARLTWSRLAEPGFISTSLRRARCDHAVWGWPLERSRSTSNEGPVDAIMHNTDASAAEFGAATIRGRFMEARFVAAKLVDADFSHSQFHGGTCQGTSFFEADLTRAKFNGAKLAAVRFSHAVMDGVDFNGAEIDPRLEYKLQLAGHLSRNQEGHIS